jgi:hypothetical protein
VLIFFEFKGLLGKGDKDVKKDTKKTSYGVLDFLEKKVIDEILKLKRKELAKLD